MRHRLAGVACAIALAAASRVAYSTPLDFLPVGDPIEEEIRVLDVLGTADSLPHLGMRPFQIRELPALDGPSTSGAAAITRSRIRRALANDRAVPDPVPGRSPRILQLSYPEDQRLEASVGLEGGGVMIGDSTALLSRSGVHMRVGAQVDRWVVHTHLILGHVDHQEFSSPLVGDAKLLSEEAYLGYTGASGLWSVQMGRSRWQWGPGQDAGLLLSKTSASLTGLALHLAIRPLRADGMILWVPLDGPLGLQLSAHRLEWQPARSLRLGVSEAAIYRSRRWEPLYGIGVLPYALVQVLLDEDQPDSSVSQRNNVLASVDASWRVLPGQKVYGEMLIDDLRTTSASIVSKYGYLVGWEGALSLGGRLAWGAEYARISRFVYTSPGLPFLAQERPLGDPDGPDTRRIGVRASWDPSSAWQAFGSYERLDAGESGLDQVFHPGDPQVPVMEFLGVVEHSNQAELGLRYWPAAGIDVSVAARRKWVEDAGHVSGARETETGGEVRLRLVR
jgi:capsule assembly protein Wzi